MSVAGKFEVAAGAIDGVNTATQRCARCLDALPLEAFGRSKHRPNGKNIYCIPCAAKKRRAWYAANKLKARAQDAEKRVEWGGVQFEKPITRGTATNRFLRLEALRLLGGRCVCCGEEREEFLTLDHIRGGGRKHRAESGTYVFRRVLKDLDPEKYRVLCYNCNCARGLRGYCPHERERTES